MVYYLFVLSFEFLQFFVGDNSCRTPQLFSPGRSLPWQHPLSQEEKLVYLGAAWARQTTAFLGLCFKFPRFLFWTSTRIERFSWDFSHAWSPKSSSFPIRGSFPLYPRRMWWEMKAAALAHTALTEFTLPSLVSLSFLAAPSSCFFKLSSHIWFYQMFS